MRAADCRSELALRARRGRLPANDATAFEGGARLEPEDGMRIARMGIAARRWAEANGTEGRLTRAYRPSRLRVALIAACWCLVAAVASGAVQVLTRSDGMGSRSDR